MDLTANPAPPRTDASRSPLIGRLGTEAQDACPVTVFLGQLLGMHVSMWLSCLLSWDPEALFSLLSAPARSNCGVHGLSLEKKLKSETLQKIKVRLSCRE